MQENWIFWFFTILWKKNAIFNFLVVLIIEVAKVYKKNQKITYRNLNTESIFFSKYKHFSRQPLSNSEPSHQKKQQIKNENIYATTVYRLGNFNVKNRFFSGWTLVFLVPIDIESSNTYQNLLSIHLYVKIIFGFPGNFYVLGMILVRAGLKNM